MMLDAISYGGRRIAGIGLGGSSEPDVRSVGIAAPGDPDVFAPMSAAQQAWVGNALVSLNTLIVQTTGTTCPTWGGGIPQAAGCFQQWYNANYAPPKAPGVTLRTDGVIDQDTLNALQMITGMHPSDFPTAFPAPAAAPTVTPAAPLPPLPAPVTPAPVVPAPAPAAAATGLSTGAMAGIAVVGAGVVGGIIYAATRGGGGKGRSKRRR